MTVNEAVTKRIYEICSQRNISLGKLCLMAGTTPSTINDIVNGITKNPGVVTLKKLCDAVDLPLTQFFDTDYFNELEHENI